MSLFSKIHTVVTAYSHELVDKIIDTNSIPVVKQYVRDLEDALSRLKHEAAVAAARVTTLSQELITEKNNVAIDIARAKSYLAKGDEKTARAVATRIT
jgi:phage shock protein A